MKRIIITAVAMLLAMYLGIAPAMAAQTVTLDFEVFKGRSGSVHTPIIEDGYILTDTLGPLRSSLPTLYVNGTGSIGSTTISCNYPRIDIILKAQDGSPFTVKSIDFAPRYNPSSAQTVKLTATFQDGRTASETVSIAGEWKLQTFTFKTFKDIVSLAWGEHSPYHQFDNIVIETNSTLVVVKPIDNQEARVGQSFNLSIPGTFKDFDGDSLTYTVTALPTGLSLSGSSIQGKPSPVKTDQSSIVTVTAVDPDDNKVSTSFKITVRANQLPEVAKTIPNQEARVGELFEFSIPSDTFKDPDGDSLTYRMEGLPKGLRLNSSNKKILGTPEDGTIGTYEVKVVAFDSNNGKVSTSFNMQVKVKRTGAPPIVEKPIPNQTATEGQPFNFTIPEGTFKDSDGDTLRYEVQGLPDGLSFNPDRKEVSGVLADGTGTTLNRVTVKVDDGNGNDATITHFYLIVKSLADTKEDLKEEIAAANEMIGRIKETEEKQQAIGLIYGTQQPDDYLKFFSARDLDFQFNVSIKNPNPSSGCPDVRLGDRNAAQADIKVLTEYIAEQEKYLQSLPK